MNKLLSESVSQLTRREALIEMFACLHDVDKLAEVADKDPVLDCALFCLAMMDPSHMENLKKLINTDELVEDITHCYEDLNKRQRLQFMLDCLNKDN